MLDPRKKSFAVLVKVKASQQIIPKYFSDHYSYTKFIKTQKTIKLGKEKIEQTMTDFWVFLFLLRSEILLILLTDISDHQTSSTSIPYATSN